MTTLPPSYSSCIEIREPQPAGTFKGLSRPVMGLLYLLNKTIQFHVFRGESKGGSEHSGLVGYDAVLWRRIVLDLSKYRNAFFSVKRDPEDEGTTIHRNARNHSPTRLGRFDSFPVSTAHLLRGVPLPICRTSALTCFLSCVEGGGVAKQEGLLASLAGIEGLRVVTLAGSSRLNVVIFFTRHTSTNRFSVHRFSNISSLLYSLSQLERLHTATYKGRCNVRRRILTARF
jgi:hypothetical protein